MEQKLHLGASTWTYLRTCGFLAAVRRLRKFGFQKLDALTIPPHLWPYDLGADQRRSLRRELAAEEVEVESLNLPSTDQNLCSVTAEMRAYSVRQFHAMIDLCQDLEVPMLVVVLGRRPSFVPPPPTDVDAWLRSALDDLLPHAERAAVHLVLENHHLSPLPTVENLVGFIESVGSNRLGIAYDVANGEFVGEHQADAITRAGRWLLQVHLSDASRQKWDHAPIGASEIDFAAIATTLRKIDFTGTSVVEVVSTDPDRDMKLARERLAALGWE